MEQMREMRYTTGVVNLINSDRGDALTSRGLGNCHGRTATMSHHTSDASGVKTCTKCGQSKPLSEFHQRRTGPRAGVYSSRCRDCDNAALRDRRATNRDEYLEQRRQYRLRTRDERLARERERRAVDPEYRDRRNTQTRRWYAKHGDKYKADLRFKWATDSEYREKQLARARHWQEQNRGLWLEIGRKSVRADRQKNPLRERARLAVRNAVREGEIPPAWAMVCQYCQEAQARHWHHPNGYESDHWLDVEAVCVECHGREHRID